MNGIGQIIILSLIIGVIVNNSFPADGITIEEKKKEKKEKYINIFCCVCLLVILYFSKMFDKIF